MPETAAFWGPIVIVRAIRNVEELMSWEAAWDAAAGDLVFRSPTWLVEWWRHFGVRDPRRELQVLLILRNQDCREDSLAGVLPCYTERTWKQGAVLRLMGDGEACSDHVGLIAPGDDAQEVAEAVAGYLAADDGWDLIDFSGVDGDDAATRTLFEELDLYDCTTSCLTAGSCWSIDLPPTWDEFLLMQSKSHRKQLRQLERRVLESGRASWKLADSTDEFSAAWAILVDLHQRRRESLGEPGCFASPAWAAFHWGVAQRLLRQGKLRLSTLQLDGEPIAAEYHLASGEASYAYQGGLDPERLEAEPGQLSTICSIKRAIEEGRRQFDFLRGDEPYKAHWRATPRPAVRLLAIPRRVWPRMRHGAWTGLRRVAGAARSLTGFFS